VAVLVCGSFGCHPNIKRSLECTGCESTLGQIQIGRVRSEQLVPVGEFVSAVLKERLGSTLPGGLMVCEGWDVTGTEAGLHPSGQLTADGGASQANLGAKRWRRSQAVKYLVVRRVVIQTVSGKNGNIAN